MTDDQARRRKGRASFSVECKSTLGAGTSFAEPMIAKQIAAYLADPERPPINKLVIVESDALLPGNLPRHFPDIVFSAGSVSVTSPVRPSSDFDIDLIVTVPHHGFPERAPVPEVPSAGETILSYLCQPDRLEATLGCLEQNFRRRAAKHGLRAAQRYYWFQVARAALSFGWDVLQRLDPLRDLLEKLKF